MVAAIKNRISNGWRRSLAVILAMIGMIATHEGTLPGYTEAIYAVIEGDRVLIMEGYWQDWPTLVVVVLGIVGLGITTLKDWKPNGASRTPQPE